MHLPEIGAMRVSKRYDKQQGGVQRVATRRKEYYSVDEYKKARIRAFIPGFVGHVKSTR